MLCAGYYNQVVAVGWVGECRGPASRQPSYGMPDGVQSPAPSSGKGGPLSILLCGDDSCVGLPLPSGGRGGDI